MNASAAAMDPWQAVTATVSDVIWETPGVATYQVQIDDSDLAARYRYRPGQFNMLYLPGVGEAAISISGDPARPDCLPHTIRAAGNVTNALAKGGKGCSIGLRGPFGSEWPIAECRGKDVILVAGGIGMAPLRPVIYELLADRDQYGQITVVYGARSPDGLLYSQQFAEWHSRLDIQFTVDRSTPDWHGHVGVVTALLERLPIEQPDNTVLLTCGPEVMMWYTIRTALDRGLKDTSMWMSLERNMNCAIGLCGHCQLGSHFVCRDGPTIRYDKVASILKVESL